MNVNIATQFLSDIERVINFKEPIAGQIHTLFIPALMGNRPVLRKSLQGRLSAWLNQNETRKSQNAKVKKIFIDSIKTIQTHPENWKTFSLSFRFKLYEEFHKAFNEQEIQLDQESENLDSLVKEVDKTIQAQQEILRNKSLLRDPSKASLELVTASDYLKFLENKPDQILQNWRVFLKNHNPSLNVEDRFTLFGTSLSFEKALQDTFFPEGIPLSDNLYATKIYEKSVEMKDTVHSLEKEQSWLFTGSYGGKLLSWEKIFKFLKKLPESTYSDLPEPFAPLFKQETLPEPEAFARKIIHEKIGGLCERLPALDLTTLLSNLNFLVPDSSRQLPDRLARILPDCLGTPLKNRLQQGLLGSTASVLSHGPDARVKELMRLLFTNRYLFQANGKGTYAPLEFIGNLLLMLPNPSIFELSQWGIQHAQEIKTPEQQQAFLKVFEEKILHHVKKLGKKALKEANQKIDKIFSNLRKVISPNLLELAGLNAFTSGEFWLEFRRQTDDQFSLFVYSTGIASNYHPRHTQTEKADWPLCIVNISPDKLTNDFFHRLLYHHLEPARNENAISRAEDLYEGILPYLDGKMVSITETETGTFNSYSATFEQLTGAVVFSPNELTYQVLYEQHLNHFLACCRSYLRDQKLVIPDEQTAEALAKGLENIKSKAEGNSKFLSPKELESLEATFQEVQQAIEAFYASHYAIKATSNNPLNLPPALIQTIRQELHQKSITFEQIQSTKSMLIWALGDEIGEFIDAFLESLESVPFVPKKTPVPLSKPKSEPKGWLQKTFASIYYQIAFEVLKVAFQIAKVYHLGFNSFLIGSLISQGLHYILPDPIYRWYLQVLHTIQQALLEMVLKIVLRTFFSTEQAQKIQDMGQQWRQTIQNFVKDLNGSRLVDYKITPSKHDVAQVTQTPAPNKVIEPSAETTLSPIKLLSIKLEPKVLLTSKNAFLNLKKWEEQSNALLAEKEVTKSDIRALRYLLNHLALLEIPNRNQGGWWDTISEKNIPFYLTTLSRLGRNLEMALDNKEICNFYLFRAFPELYAKTACAHHNLLCLMDKLSRRCPDSHLEDYSINTYNLLTWLKNSHSIVSDPLILEQLRKICDYFFPDLDFDDIQSMTKLSKKALEILKARKTLFHYAFDVTNEEHLNAWLSSSNSTNPSSELCYLKELLKKPEIMKKCEKLVLYDPSLVKDNDQAQTNPVIIESNCRFDSLSLNQQLAILFNLSTCIDDPNPIIPRSYTLLRMQSLFCNQFFKDELYRLNHIYNFKSPSHYEVKATNHSSIFQQLFGSNPPVEFLLYNSSNRSLFKKISTSPDFEPSFGKYHSMNRVSQSHLHASFSKIDEDPLFRTELADPFERELYYLTRCEPEDQLVRIIAFFKTHKNKLSLDYPYILTYLEIGLFRTGDLARQLKKSPHFAKVLADFFTELCQEQKTSAFLWMVQLGIKVKKYCSYYVPASGAAFPNFYQILKSYPIESIQTDKLDNLHYKQLMAIAYAHEMPADSLEQKAEQVLDLLKPIPSDSTQTNSSYTEDFYKVFSARLATELEEAYHIVVASIKQKTNNLTVLNYKNPNSTPSAKNVASDGLIRVSAEEAKNTLEPFRRFCLPTEINCWRKPEEDRIEKINFVPYNLSFTVKKIGNEWQAFSSNQQYPGFAIAVQQVIPILQGFTSYLLLEGQNNQKKVLLPTDKLLEALIARFIPIGPFLPFFAHHLEQRTNFNTYFAYDLDSKGSLTSENFHALLHLMTLYLIQGNKAKIWETCDQLEMLCRQHPMEKNLGKTLLIFSLIPFEQNITRRIRQRLFAALEENRLLHPIQTERRSYTEKLEFSAEDLAITVHIALDLTDNLKEKNLRRKLTPAQEWFLFRSFFNHSRRLFVSQNSPALLTLVEKMGWDNVMEFIGLNTELAQRYRELKQKYGHQNSLSEKALSFLNQITQNSFVKDFKQAPSLMTTLNQQNLVKNFSINVSDDFFKMGRAAYEGFYSNTNDLNFIQFKREMLPNISLDAPLNSDKLKAESFFIYFLTYYTIAKEGKNSKQAEKFQTFLSLNKGGWDSQTQQLMQYLEAVMNTPLLFWSSEELMKALEPEKLISEDIQKLDLRPFLGKTIHSFIQDNIPLTLEKFNMKDFYQYFLSYYAIARGERGPGERLKLQKLLPDLEEQIDSDKKILFICLQEAIETSLDDYLDLRPFLEKKVILRLVKDEVPLTLENFDLKDFYKYFLSYYAIARGEIGPVERRKLRAFLPSLENLIDPDKKGLITCLDKAIKRGINYRSRQSLFYSAEEIIKAKYKETGKVYVYRPDTKQLQDFFSHLHRRALSWKMGSKGVRMAGSMIYNYGLRETAAQLTPGLNLIPFPYLTMSTLNYVGKMGYALWKKQSSNQATPKQIEPAIQISNPYQGLEADDQMVDQFLSEVFSSVFAQDTSYSKKPELRVQELSKTDDPIDQDRIDRVNKGIKDFYNRPIREKPKYRLKNIEQLWEAYVVVKPFQVKYKENWQKEQAKLLQSLNQSLSESNALTLEDLKKALLDGDFRALGAELHLSIEALRHLERALVKCYLKQARLKQLERLVGHFETLAQFPLNEFPKKFQAKVEEIAQECLARRTYKFDQIPLRLLRHLILFEGEEGVLLWEKQVLYVRERFAVGNEKSVSELIMGLGKTTFGLPTESSHNATGEETLFLIWTKQMAETNTRQGSKQSKRIYGQDTSVFSYNSSIPLDKERLEALSVAIQRAKENKEAIHTTKEDCQSLELRLFNWLFSLAHPEIKTCEASESEVLQLKDILKEIRYSGRFVADEVQEVFKNSQMLNQPLGPKSTIPMSYYLVMEACMKILIKDVKILQIIKENNFDLLTKNEYEDEVVPLLAQKMSLHSLFKFKTTEERQDFIQYVTGQLEEAPASLTNNSHYKEICTVKGMIEALLPMLFSKTAHVTYGNDKHDYADPFDGNMNPSLNSKIRQPFETVIKTMALILQQGLKKKQVNTLITYLQVQAKIANNKLNISIPETKPYRIFKKLFPDEDLMTVTKKSSEELEEFYQKAQYNYEAIFTYLRFFVQKEIVFWRLNISSNAHNFYSMFKLGSGVTGTPYNNGTYPAPLKMLWDPGTIGEALHIITNRCPANGIHVLENSQPKKVLTEILKDYFAFGSRFSAIIDGGALLKGMDSQEVAEAILAYCKQNRPDIKAVVFFKKDKTKKDQLVFLEKEGAEGPFDQCPFSSSEYISYFDQNHGFAANIPQKKDGIGLKLVGKELLSDALQHYFRMRGLKNENQVLPITPPKTGQEEDSLDTQQIHVALTKELQKEICGNEVPTLEPINLYATCQEAKGAEEHFPAYQRMIHNVIRSAVRDKILNCDKVKKMIRIFLEFERIIVNEMVTDPEILWGGNKTQCNHTQLIESYKKEMLVLIQNSSVFTDREKADIKDTIEKLPKPIMPKKITVYLNRKTQKISLFDDFGQEVTHETNQHEETNVNEQVNEQLNEDLTQEMQMQNARSPHGEFEEGKWNPTIDSHSVDWQLIGKTSTKNGYLNDLWFSSSTKAPPVFRFSTTLSETGLSTFTHMYSAIDSRLWFTNNFIPRQVHQIWETSVYIGSKDQRELMQVLIDIEEEDHSYRILSMGCLSIQDAAFWREKLHEKDKQKKMPRDFKRVLYDIELRTVVSGDEIDVEKLRESVDLKSLEVQLKFLNGDVNYPPTHIETLKNWLIINNVEKMHDAFHHIYSQRGKNNYDSSSLESLFENLLTTEVERQ